jgi:hypothetical protein
VKATVSSEYGSCATETDFPGYIVFVQGTCANKAWLAEVM